MDDPEGRWTKERYNVKGRVGFLPGNPGRRPVALGGKPNWVARARQQMEEALPQVVEKIVEQAVGGCVQSQKLLLDKCVASRKEHFNLNFEAVVDQLSNDEVIELARDAYHLITAGSGEISGEPDGSGAEAEAEPR